MIKLVTVTLLLLALLRGTSYLLNELQEYLLQVQLQVSKYEDRLAYLCIPT